MDKAGRIVSAIVVAVRLAVKQQVVDVRVVFLHAVERRAHGVAAADHELCAALGGSAQGGLGLVCGVARGSLGVGGIAVRVGERLYALPQHGILAGFRAAGAGHQHDGLSAGQCGRRVIGLVDKGRVVRRGGYSVLLLRGAGSLRILAGGQPCQQRQRQKQC